MKSFFLKLYWWLFFSVPLSMKSICDITCCHLLHLKQWTVVLMTSHLVGHYNARFHSYFTSSVTNVDQKLHRLSSLQQIYFGPSNWSLQKNITKTLNGKQNNWVWSFTTCISMRTWHGLRMTNPFYFCILNVYDIHSQLCIMNRYAGIYWHLYIEYINCVLKYISNWFMN